MRIKVDKSKLLKVSNNLKNNSDLLEKEKFNILNIFEELSNAWIGNDYDVLYKKINDIIIPIVNKEIEAIDNLGIYLSKVPKVYDSLDDIYKSKQILKK